MPNNNSMKLWTFRLVAFGGSLCISMAFAVWLLFSQERIVVDPESNAIEWRSGPIYLEEPGHEVTGHRYLYDERLGWRNIPNWRASTHGSSLTINSKGLRDREYAYEKPTSVKRILVLGDSFAWGYGVSDKEIFTEVLETRLEQSPTTWEVINAGVSGWGTDQEYLYLLDEGFRYEPDIVVLAMFVVNDFENNYYAWQYGLNKPLFLDETLTLSEFPVPKPSEDVALGRSNAEPLPLTLAIVRAMANECARRDVRFVLAKFGMFLDLKFPPLDELDAQFTVAMADQAPTVFFLDLDRAFVEAGISREQLTEGNDDGHWNAFGHQQTSDILLQFMNEKDLIKHELVRPKLDRVGQ
ncbi:SGNH/GDSL hydrolase family protein [Neorhodopirellula lusitana]|uniref:SGNH/GDSL hydrolase family protein n=1 Tax=Neorhodopirellula lusitana TaxID=445327 RepID=UPI00384E4810